MPSTSVHTFSTRIDELGRVHTTGCHDELKMSQSYPPAFGVGIAKVYVSVCARLRNLAIRNICDLVVSDIVDVQELLNTRPTDMWEEADVMSVFEFLARMAPHVRGWWNAQ